jgi:hypothetical protein
MLPVRWRRRDKERRVETGIRRYQQHESFEVT